MSKTTKLALDAIYHMKNWNMLTLFLWPNDQIKAVLAEILTFFPQNSVLHFTGDTLPEQCNTTIKLIVADQVPDLKTLRAWHSIQITGIRPDNKNFDAKPIRPAIVIISKLSQEQINMLGQDFLKIATII
jgi:hypothetical protein